MEGLAHVYGLVLHARVQLDLFQELLGDHFERVLWPGHEPVDRAAVDERGEHAQARAEGVTDRTHGQDHVQVGLDAVDEVVEHGHCARFD